MLRITRCSAIVLLALVLPALSFDSWAQTALPPVVVVGQRTDGGTIICRGYACAGVLGILWARAPVLDVASISPEVDGDQFCQYLNASKPSGCSATNPPPSPGINVPGMPTWQANGCGTGPLANLFADVLLEIVTRPTYSGNFQAPYPGVSFSGACNGHDQCWAMGGIKDVCDYGFRQDMINACGGDSAANNVCIGFSGLYHGAVTNTGMAQDAYNKSVSGRACALWASDMRENGCQ